MCTLSFWLATLLPATTSGSPFWALVTPGSRLLPHPLSIRPQKPAVCASQHHPASCWKVEFCRDEVAAAHHTSNSGVQVLAGLLALKRAGGVTHASSVARCSRTAATWQCIGAATQARGHTSVTCAATLAHRAASLHATWKPTGSLARRCIAATFATCPSASTAPWKNTWRSGMVNTWWAAMSNLSRQIEPKLCALKHILQTVWWV